MKDTVTIPGRLTVKARPDGRIDIFDRTHNNAMRHVTVSSLPESDVRARLHALISELPIGGLHASDRRREMICAALTD